MSNPLSLSEYERPKLETPTGGRLLLHSCCAPCSGEVMEALRAGGVDYSVYFYNPNIHPRSEYTLRKDENKRYCDAHNIEWVEDEYDTDAWFERIEGLEDEPERGARCTACFDMRFERTADYAAANGYECISSSLGISRWKDMNQINRCGEQAASRHKDMVYWTINWRKGGGSARMIELAKQENFYQQEYCGCVYSLRDTNRSRQARGYPRIKRGVRYYGEIISKDVGQ